MERKTVPAATPHCLVYYLMDHDTYNIHVSAYYYTPHKLRDTIIAFNEECRCRHKNNGKSEETLLFQTLDFLHEILIF